VSYDVFISYARAVSAASARALCDELVARGVSVFLDESAIDVGDRFPTSIVDALLSARVVVAFMEPVYFTRWYCVWEWRATLAGYEALVASPTSTTAVRDAALEGVVLVLPADGSAAALQHAPPALQQTNWPWAGDPARVAIAVVEVLARVPQTLAIRTAALHGERFVVSLREQLLSVARIPAPQTPNRPHPYALGLPATVGERFVGRAEELWKINYLLTTQPGATGAGPWPTVTVVAVGGVGKTRLAAEYVHRVAATRFRGGVIWIDLGDEIRAERDRRYHDVLTALNGAHGTPTLPLAAYRDPAALQRLHDDLRAAVARASANESVLVVLDNVPEPLVGQRPADVEQLWPAVGLTPLIVTSRLRVGLGTEHDVRTIALPPLEPAPARQLLTRSVVRAVEISQAEWDAITAWVGHLPLALTLLNAGLEADAVRPSELRTWAVDDHNATTGTETVLDALRESVPAGALRGVVQVFGTSFERLPFDAQFAAGLLAELGPFPIPEAIAERLPEVFTRAVRTILVSRSIVTPVVGAAPAMLGQMHRLLADFIRVWVARTKDDRGTGNAILRRVLLGATGHDQAHQPAQRPLLRLLVAHARYIIARTNWARPEAVQEAVMLARNCGGFLWLDKDFPGALSVEAEAVELARRHLGADDSLTLNVEQNYAMSLMAVGDLDQAGALFDRILPASERVFGPTHEATFLTLGAQASLLSKRGDAVGALDVGRRVLVGRQAAFGHDAPATLMAHNNVAIFLDRAGHIEEARAMLATVLERRCLVLGAEHIDSLRSKANLAAQYGRAHDFGAAVPLSEEAMQGFVRQLGPRHRETLEIRLNHASILSGAGERTAAVSELRAIVEDCEREGLADEPVAATAREGVAWYATTERPATA